MRFTDEGNNEYELKPEFIRAIEDYVITLTDQKNIRSNWDWDVIEIYRANNTHSKMPLGHLMREEEMS